MQGLRQFGMAALISVVSLGLAVGGLSLAFSESYTPPLSTATQELPTAPIFLTGTATANSPATPTTQPTATNTPLPPPACNPPMGWVSAPVLAGDTLASLAVRYRTTPEQLSQANCLLTDELIPGTTLFVPPVPAPTVIPCGPPYNWVRYIIQAGDTLYSIATRYGITTSRLQQANCLGYSTTIIAGKPLWVPNTPTLTPGVTVIPEFSTPTPMTVESTPTEPLTETPAPATNTPEPTNTAEPSSTPVPPPTETITAFPS